MNIQGVIDIAEIDTTNVNYEETIRLMLADYFYGENPITPFPFIQYGERRLAFLKQPFDLRFSDETFMNQLFAELEQGFWLLADMIGRLALQQTPDYQHRPSDCLYSYHRSNVPQITIYLPVYEGLPALNIAPAPIAAVAVACRETLPESLQAVMANIPEVSFAPNIVGDY